MIFDNTQMFFSSGALSKSNTVALVPSSGIKIRGTSVKGLSARVSIPTTAGSWATILPSIYVSEDDSTYKLQAVYPGGATVIPAGGKDLVIPFEAPRKYKYVKMYFAIADGTTGGGGVYGNVKAGITVRTLGDFDRTVDFS